MAYRDLRDWIDRLDQAGELLRIKEEINLEPDAGAIGRAICDIQGPGILAEKVAGFETRMSICLHASFRRAAMAMGLPKDTSLREQKQAWIRAYERYPVKSKMVKDAPCKENILRGDQVNLFNFPIPRLSLHDASFYISKPMTITKDPDSDWINVGMYRMMLLDRNRTCVLAETPQHIGEHYMKSRRLGKPLEVAVALGTEPVLPMVAGMKIPHGWNEFDYAGAVRGEPMELVKAETVDLPVPARAEIILEGVLRHDEQAFEGPFAEYTGCYSGYFMAPVFELTAITHRNDPIYDALYCGKPNAEHYMTLLSKCAGVEQELKSRFPQITEVTLLWPYTNNTVIQGRWFSRGEPKLVMNAFWSTGMGTIAGKLVTVVDEDVDPWNADDVLWAIATRCQADVDVVMIPGMDCYVDPSLKLDGTTCRFGIDATKSRPPYPRHRLVEWVAPRKETQAWRQKLERLMKGGS